MGFVYADIELINGEDLVLSRRHLIGEEEVKRMTVNMMVDSGAINMCINEYIQEYMKFPSLGKKKFIMASGKEEELEVVSNVEVRFQNRSTECRAVVLPGDNEALLGAIPLEDLDVIIDPRRQELVVNPDSPDMQSARLGGVRYPKKSN